MKCEKLRRRFSFIYKNIILFLMSYSFYNYFRLGNIICVLCRICSLISRNIDKINKLLVWISLRFWYVLYFQDVYIFILYISLSYKQKLYNFFLVLDLNLFYVFFTHTNIILEYSKLVRQISLGVRVLQVGTNGLKKLKIYSKQPCIKKKLGLRLTKSAFML